MICIINAINFEFPRLIINDCLFHWKYAICCKIIDLEFDDIFNHILNQRAKFIVTPVHTRIN